MAARRIIFAETITEEGLTWILKETGVLVKFLPEAVSNPRPVTCYLWSTDSVSYPLEKYEALVSNVIELSCGNSVGVSFDCVSVALSHSAVKLKGMELVMKELTDPVKNVWQDLKSTEIQPQALQDEHSTWQSTLPLVRANITGFSRYAVICRLKSFRFSKGSFEECHQFECSLSEFPGIIVSIPRTSLPSKSDFACTIKVEEVSSDNFEENGVHVGPIAHFLCNSSDEVKGPVSISIPITSQQKQIDWAKIPTSLISVFSRGEKSEWSDITNELDEPPTLNNGVVTFQLNGIKRSPINHNLQYWAMVNVSEEREDGRERFVDDSYRPQEVGFLAFLCNQQDPEEKKLILCCFPFHMKSELKRDICSKFEVLRQGEGKSCKQLSNGDLVYFSVPDGLSPVDTGLDVDNTPLTFCSGENSQTEILVRCEMTEGEPLVKFFKRKNVPGEEEILSTLSFPQTRALEDPSPVISTEISPSQEQPSVTEPSVSVKSPVDDSAQIEELRNSTVTSKTIVLSQEDIGNCWKDLGILLGVPEGVINNIGADYDRARERGFAVLEFWKEKRGSSATVGCLEKALIKIHKKSIAEKILGIVREEKPIESEHNDSPEKEGDAGQRPTRERGGSTETMPSTSEEVNTLRTRDVAQSEMRDEAGREKRHLDDLKECIGKVEKMNEVVKSMLDGLPRRQPKTGRNDEPLKMMHSLLMEVAAFEEVIQKNILERIARNENFEGLREITEKIRKVKEDFSGAS